MWIVQTLSSLIAMQNERSSSLNTAVCPERFHKQPDMGTCGQLPFSLLNSGRKLVYGHSSCLQMAWRSLLTPPYLLTSPLHLPSLFSSESYFVLFRLASRTFNNLRKVYPGMAASDLNSCWFFSLFCLVLLYMWTHLQLHFDLFSYLTNFCMICNPYLLDWAKNCRLRHNTQTRCSE